MLLLLERSSTEVIGHVEARFLSWQPLHIISGNITQNAYSRLLAEARKSYQGNIDVVNIIAIGTYNPLSIIAPPIAGTILANFQTIRVFGDVILLGGTGVNVRRLNDNQSGVEAALNNATEVIMNSLQMNSKLAIVNISSVDRDLSEFISHELEFILVTNRYTVVDRSELDKIRREQNFQISGEVDDSTIVSIGRFAGADVVLTGAVTGTGYTRRLRLRALNTQTAQVMAVASERF
jgi:hypothetical protein